MQRKKEDEFQTLIIIAILALHFTLYHTLQRLISGFETSIYFLRYKKIIREKNIIKNIHLKLFSVIVAI